MTSLPSPTMILIIPLMLNTIMAPDKSVPEIVYRRTTDDESQHGDLSSSAAGNHPWLPPTDLCSGHFSIANTTDDSSVLLLLLVSLPVPVPVPGPGGQQHPRSRREANRTAPWTSLPLEPAGSSYGGVPQAREGEDLSLLYPFLSNLSLDVGLFSFANSSTLLAPKVMYIEENQQRHLPEAPTLYGVVLCNRGDGYGSFIETLFFQEARMKVPDYVMESAALPRKLLDAAAHGAKLGHHQRQKRRQSGAHPSKTIGNLAQPAPARRQVSGHGKQCVLATTTGGAVAVVASAALLAHLCTIIAGCVLLRCTRNMKKPEAEVPGMTELSPSAPRFYSHRELAVATRGFADNMKIGRGGFGPVYRGYLGYQDRRHVAVKVLSPREGSSSGQGVKEFESEVKIMSRLRHRNIVQLLGWCDDAGPSRDLLLLVYELVANGSLDKHLYDPHRVLPWSNRYNIALGVGSGIQYLHTECEQCVVHGDIKPANIMLDSSFQPKLGDFGLARLLDHGADPATTQVVAGTIGYIDPELVNSRQPSAMSDVYSFGIVLLEIACGRRVNWVHLLNWVGSLYQQNAILRAADRRLDGEFDERQMERVLVTGLWCAHRDQSRRPSIAQAMDVLRREDAELPVFGPVDAVRSLELEEGGYSEFLGGDATSETEYHTSQDSTYLLAPPRPRE